MMHMMHAHAHTPLPSPQPRHLTDAHAFPLLLDGAAARLAAGALHPSHVYTSADLRAVVAAARLRGVRVVPELDMPAHTASWGLAAPELVVACPRRVAEDAEGLEHGANRVALHPLREVVYQMVSVLLAELSAIFPDDFFHLGGDEVDAECWLSDAEVKAWATKAARLRPHLPWKAQLQALFTGRVVTELAKHGKQPLLWDEALEMGALLPEAVAVDVWRDWLRAPSCPEGYCAEGELREQALRTGRSVVHSALAWYLDLPQNTWISMYEVELPRAPPAALLGGEASSWGEHCDVTNLQQVVLTRAAAVAERLWSERRSATDVARQRLASFRCRLLRRGLQAAPVFPDACDAPVAPHPAHPFGAPPANATTHSRVPLPPPNGVVVPPADAVSPSPPPCVPHIPRIPHVPHVPHVPHAATTESAAQEARLFLGSRAPALVSAALLASLALSLLLCTRLWRRQRPPSAPSSAERRPKSD